MNAETSTPPTITFHYRLYTYKNALDETVYQVKRKGFLGVYWWVGSDFLDCDPYQWTNREDVMCWIRANAESRRNALVKERASMKRAKLRLIVSEDITA